MVAVALPPSLALVARATVGATVIWSSSIAILLVGLVLFLERLFL